MIKLTQDKLFIVAMVMMLIGIFISTGTLWYVVKNKDTISESIQNSVLAELAKYKLPTEDLSEKDARLLIAVAKYCESHNGCKGKTGDSIVGPKGNTGPAGKKGLDGKDGSDGLQGLIGLPGPQGMSGENGTNGADGRPVERRCNVNRMEWRIQGDESWQVEFKLAEGQSCAVEGGEDEQ